MGFMHSLFAVPFAMPVESHRRRIERFEIELAHHFLCSKRWKSLMHPCSSRVVSIPFSFNTSRTIVATNCDPLPFRIENPAKRYTKMIHDASLIRCSFRMLNFSLPVRDQRRYTSMPVVHSAFRLILQICIYLIFKYIYFKPCYSWF